MPDSREFIVWSELVHHNGGDQ